MEFKNCNRVPSGNLNFFMLPVHPETGCLNESDSLITRKKGSPSISFFLVSSFRFSFIFLLLLYLFCESMMNNSFDMNVTHTNSSYRNQDMGVEDGEKESSSQYCKGFFDALRVVQSTNKFEFNGVTSPVLPNNLSTAAFSPITPATASDMHTIVMSILGTPITSASSTIPPLSSPTSLLPLVTSGDLQMDDLSMKLLASSAIPGPPIVSSSNSPDSSSAVNTTTTQITALPPLLNNFVSSTTASTSRPDKLNLTPPQSEISMSMANYSDDSDGGFDSRSASRAGGSGG
ncbi:hypothetical protein B9Z55_005489 [Caenorhabditis nigoni]|uniref:Uncharacterized protein n=2 Tax=Caenorhabditis nigoni TaxID=1611254 RepID=A0A2G5V1I3_9PELO|nr:hypothetical protein B9Z55_005489 [Caenorhabditis nigoni]